MAAEGLPAPGAARGLVAGGLEAAAHLDLEQLRQPTTVETPMTTERETIQTLDPTRAIMAGPINRRNRSRQRLVDRYPILLREIAVPISEQIREVLQRIRRSPIDQSAARLSPAWFPEPPAIASWRLPRWKWRKRRIRRTLNWVIANNCRCKVAMPQMKSKSRRNSNRLSKVLPHR